MRVRACCVEVEGASEREARLLLLEEGEGEAALSPQPPRCSVAAVCVCCCSCNARSLSVDDDVDRFCPCRCFGLPRPPSFASSSARAIARSLTTRERGRASDDEFRHCETKKTTVRKEGVTEQVPILPTFAAFSVAREKRDASIVSVLALTSAVS